MGCSSVNANETTKHRVITDFIKIWFHSLVDNKSIVYIRKHGSWYCYAKPNNHKIPHSETA